MRTTVDIPDSTYRKLKARPGDLQLPIVPARERGALHLTNETA